jgi:hypothetical protein
MLHRTSEFRVRFGRSPSLSCGCSCRPRQAQKPQGQAIGPRARRASKSAYVFDIHRVSHALRCARVRCACRVASSDWSTTMLETITTQVYYLTSETLMYPCSAPMSAPRPPPSRQGQNPAQMRDVSVALVGSKNIATQLFLHRSRSIGYGSTVALCPLCWWRFVAGPARERGESELRRYELRSARKSM